MKQINLVGIDVSAKELVLKIEKASKVLSDTFVFDNTGTGHKKLIKFITEGGHDAQVCMEATGVYHSSLATVLARHAGIQVMVVNGKVIKHFAVASKARGKTDAVDAQLILRYLNCMPFMAWEPPAERCLALQVINRRLFQLKEEVRRDTNRRHTGEYNEVMAQLVNHDIEVNLRHLRKRIKLLEKKALELINKDEELKQQFIWLTSIKGVAQTSGIQLLAELSCMPKDMSAPQWVANSGLDPRARESGSSLNKPRRISKAGNRYLRAALYMPALVAIQHESHVKGFYEKLIAAGKKPLQAIVAVMRKLLHSIWGMFTHKEAWNGEKFYVHASVKSQEALT